MTFQEAEPVQGSDNSWPKKAHQLLRSGDLRPARQAGRVTFGGAELPESLGPSIVRPSVRFVSVCCACMSEGRKDRAAGLAEGEVVRGWDDVEDNGRERLSCLGSREQPLSTSSQMAELASLLPGRLELQKLTSRYKTPSGP